MAKLCVDCRERPVKETTIRKDGKREPYARCVECQREVNRADMQRSRLAKRKEELKQNPELEKIGRKICAQCFRKKRLSEYRTSLPGGCGFRNKICDTCLTKIYSYRKGHGSEFDTGFWRRRAYSCNTTARRRLNRQREDGTVEIAKLTDLPWICKPQDLSRRLRAQDGRCAYCRVKITTSNMGVDHKVPLAVGGAHKAANLDIVCKDCNQLKGTRTDVEFRTFLTEYVQRFA